MTYIDIVASQVERRVPSGLLPDGDTRSLFRLYALLVLVKGTAVEAADVHNAWAVWMQERSPNHHSIRPFEELDTETQASDEPFVKAIKEVAGQINRNIS